MGSFDWRWAFDPDMDVSSRNLAAVKNTILNWSDWTVKTDSIGFIVRVEDSDEDGIWDWDWDDSEDADAFFPSDFIRYMDAEFKIQKYKTKVVVGTATILPIPGDRPPSSSKGAPPSSNL